MQIIKRLFKPFFFLLPTLAAGQSTYIPQQSEDFHFLDRQEILSGGPKDNFFSVVKPYTRRELVQQSLYYDSLLKTIQGKGKDSFPDRVYDLDYCKIMNSCTEELHESTRCHPQSRRPLGQFYRNQTQFFEVDNKDFYLSVNPVFQFYGGTGSADSQSLYLNSRGLTIRARIAGKIGLSSTVIENQERGPDFFTGMVTTLDAMPGTGFYKIFKKTGYDYLDARGYITFSAAKFIDFQFGYDKNFIGDGFRSLFLSDWGNSYLFLKINTHFWKLDYQNLFMELMPERYGPEWNIVLDRKYAAMHHLSINATRWLNVGLFESVVFGRQNHFDFQYLNPVIFYRHAEGAVGSPDNAMMGLDAKADVMKKLQFYGQFLVDEFLISKVRNDAGNWVNKFGFQMGAKYVNAFGIPNLDLQAEWNRVRPFTYSHFDSVANFTHYNQPLAHPLGANFQELIGILRYRPVPRLFIYGRAIYYYKGLDSAGRNFGGNIFRDYTTRDMESGFRVGSGEKVKCLNGLLRLSYEWKPNLFLEMTVQHRIYKGWESEKTKNTLLLAGIRWNMWSRNYDY